MLLTANSVIVAQGRIAKMRMLRGHTYYEQCMKKKIQLSTNIIVSELRLGWLSLDLPFTVTNNPSAPFQL